MCKASIISTTALKKKRKKMIGESEAYVEVEVGEVENPLKTQAS
jgi:hypothetical protein